MRAGPGWPGLVLESRLARALFCQCKQDSAVPGRCINGVGTGHGMRVKWRETHGRTTKPMGCWILGETRLYSLYWKDAKETNTYMKGLLVTWKKMDTREHGVSL